MSEETKEKNTCRQSLKHNNSTRTGTRKETRAKERKGFWVRRYLPAMTPRPGISILDESFRSLGSWPLAPLSLCPRGRPKSTVDRGLAEAPSRDRRPKYVSSSSSELTHRASSSSIRCSSCGFSCRFSLPCSACSLIRSLKDRLLPPGVPSGSTLELEGGVLGAGVVRSQSSEKDVLPTSAMVVRV